MNLLNYNTKTGDFKLTLTATLSAEELELLRYIRTNKSATWQSLFDELKAKKGEDEAHDEISTHIHLTSGLKDLHLIEETHIMKDQKVVDWAYRLTDTGRALLNIVEQQKGN
jgi:hypothetical protein